MAGEHRMAHDSYELNQEGVDQHQLWATNCAHCLLGFLLGQTLYVWQSEIIFRAMCLSSNHILPPFWMSEVQKAALPGIYCFAFLPLAGLATAQFHAMPFLRSWRATGVVSLLIWLQFFLWMVVALNRLRFMGFACP